MIAQDLSQVFNAFKFNKPLVDTELNEYYKERDSPIDVIASALLKTDEPLKFLFTGHRGCGKSTELNILAERVKERYFVVKFLVSETLDVHDLSCIDLLITLGSQVYTTAYQNGIKIDKKLCEDLLKWMGDRTKIEITEDKAGAGVEGTLHSLFVKFGSKIHTEATTREEIRGELKPRLSELIEKINNIIYGVESNLNGKKVLVIIDDLDKLDLDESTQLFHKNMGSLILPKCSVVYTIPLSLMQSNKYNQIKYSFTDSRTLPNIKINKSDGKDDEDGMKILRDIAEKRMNLELITDDALKTAIKGSGGLLFHFIYIIKFAGIEAESKNKDVIDKKDVDAILSDMRNDFDRILREEHYDILDRIHKTKNDVDGDILMDLFENLSVLEYLNEKRWCDVHPLIIPLLEREWGIKKEKIKEQ